MSSSAEQTVSSVEVVYESAAWQQEAVKVSGILITYNQAAFVEAAVRSLLQQTYPMDVVISDDCSSDETFALIRQMIRSYRGPHQITLCRNFQNRGICSNQNAAI